MPWVLPLVCDPSSCNRNADLSKQAQGLNRNAPALRFRRQGGVGAVILGVECGLRRRYALALIGEIILLQARERASGGISRVIERIRSIDLVGDILIVLPRNDRGFAGGDAAAVGHLIGAGKIAACRGELAVHGIADIGLDLRKLCRERRVVADHRPVRERRQLALESAEIALHVAGLCVGAATIQKAVGVAVDLPRIGISLRRIALQAVEGAGFRRRQSGIVQAAADLPEDALQHWLRRLPRRGLRLLAFVSMTIGRPWLDIPSADRIGSGLYRAQHQLRAVGAHGQPRAFAQVGCCDMNQPNALSMMTCFASKPSSTQSQPLRPKIRRRLQPSAFA